MAEKTQENLDIEKKILSILGANARISINDLAGEVHIDKNKTYEIFNSIVEKYGIRFVPEINIDALWHMEFARQARLQTKRSIIGEAEEMMSNVGFSEYLMQIKFEEKAPNNDELISAAEKEYWIQFLAKTHGNYDALAYIVARPYDDLRYIISKLGAALKNYDMEISISKIWPYFGFFPLSKSLISQLKLFETYKNLLVGLLNAGRKNFSEMGKEFGQGYTQMLYSYDRLYRTNVLRRVTYYETKPNKKAYEAVSIKITNKEKFEKSKEEWYMHIIEQANKGEQLYVYACETIAPFGNFVILAGESTEEIKKEINYISKLKGVKVSSTHIDQSLIGALGIREFDMRYSFQYQYLESRNKVPRIQEAIQKIEESPDRL